MSHTEQERKQFKVFDRICITGKQCFSLLNELYWLYWLSEVEYAKKGHYAFFPSCVGVLDTCM